MEEINEEEYREEEYWEETEIISCPNMEIGCEWRGEPYQIGNHLENTEGCQFQEVVCYQECGWMIQRQYLTSHVQTECPQRQVNCQYCNVQGEYQFIKGDHLGECPMLSSPCPNNCGVVNIPPEDVEAHRKECLLEMIQCEYYNVGCEDENLPRKDQEKHDNEMLKEHLKMTKNELTTTKGQLNETNSQLDAALKEITNLTVLLKAQLFPSTSDAKLRSDQLDTMATMFKSVCPVTLKMSEFNNKKANSIQWYSDPFYTHNKGYKMCLHIDVTGYYIGRGSHLSVYLYLMKGPHDDELTWPLRGKLQIKLLNQISNNKHRSATVTYDDKTSDSYAGRVINGDRAAGGWGYHQFISVADLSKITSTRQFLRNDCLFFQVSV